MLGFLKTMFRGDAPAKPAAKPRTAAAKTPIPAPTKTPRRAELIGEAMKIHRAKREIFDDLSDDSRAKLVAMTVLAMLNPGEPPDQGKT